MIILFFLFFSVTKLHWIERSLFMVEWKLFICCVLTSQFSGILLEVVNVSRARFLYSAFIAIFLFVYAVQHIFSYCCNELNLLFDYSSHFSGPHSYHRLLLLLLLLLFVLVLLCHTHQNLIAYNMLGHHHHLTCQPDQVLLIPGKGVSKAR
jgi:hypothetical protein